MKKKKREHEERQLKNTLRKFRFMCGEMSQEELANKLGVSRQTIHAIERSKFNPSVKLALKMAELFQVKVEEIFFLEKEND